MKNTTSKFIVALLAVFCFAVPAFVGNVDAEAADTTESMYVVESYTFDEASPYFKDNTAPTYEPGGYVFAGWYAEGENVNTETTGEGYFAGSPVVTLVGYMHENVQALFVKESVLDVKGQIAILDNADGSAGDDNTEVATVTSTTNANLRLITSVDSLKYQQVGFEINYPYNNATVTTGSETNYVYKSLTVVDGTGESADTTLTPSEVFAKCSQYFKACTVSGIPKDAFETEFLVRAYWITADGATVYGSDTMLSKSVQEGIYHTYEAGVGTMYYKELEAAVASVSASETEATVTVFKNAEVASDTEVTGIVKVTNREDAKVTIYRAATLTSANVFSVASGAKLTIIGTEDENSIVFDGRTATLSEVSSTAPLIYNSQSGELTITNATIQHAKDTSTNATTGSAGAIFNYKGILTVTNARFLTNTGTYGAAVRTAAGGTTTITGCTFGGENEGEGNNVTKDGGAIYNQGTTNVVDSHFLGNTSTGNGGAVCNHGSGHVFSAEDSRFLNNVASGAGGAIANVSSATLILTKVDSDNAVFKGNESRTTGGGAINMTGGNLTVTGYTFSGNYTVGAGGAIRTYAGTTRTITGATFEGNYTTGDEGHGGAVYIGGTGAEISGTTFKENHTKGSSAHGGALYLAKPVANTTLSDITYVDNDVKGTGSEGADLYSVE